MFLLIAGANYYPEHGTHDWQGCFSSASEAEEKVRRVEYHDKFVKGPRKGQIKSTTSTYEIAGQNYDWYEVVDLREWIRDGELCLK